MAGGIYVLQRDKQLIELREQEYDSENLLQELLAEYPNLLAGDQIDSAAPRRWLLVGREMGVPSEKSGSDRWSLDHLFLDQDAVPTIVEVKRSTDTRIRREVVGQMLDYAANAVVYWPVERLLAEFEQTCVADGRDASQVVSDFIEEGSDPAAFWQRAKTNLQAGRVRLVFVADQIPAELRRIVEFLNGQMDPAEVLALEVRQYVGGQLKTLVPRVIGLSAEAERRKSVAGRVGRQWDQDSFLDDLTARTGSEDAAVVRRVLSWAQARGLQTSWGRGKQEGSVAPILDLDGRKYRWFTIYTYGRLDIAFETMKTRPPFDNEETRRELLRRLTAVPGISLPEDSIDRRPSLALSDLRNREMLDGFLSVMDWAVDQTKTVGRPRG